MFWNAAPALVEGNTIVIKPSEDAPMSTQAAVEIYAEAGIPRGVINLVHGDGATGDSLVRVIVIISALLVVLMSDSTYVKLLLIMA